MKLESSNIYKWKGIVDLTPPIWNSRKARLAIAMASCAAFAPTMSLAIIES